MWYNFLRKISLRKPKPLKWSIVIDPGHGGKHPGAVNKKYGYMEKNINLHVAEFMRTYINDQVPELRAYSTRRADRTVSLPRRCQLANSGYVNEANYLRSIDAFISIHTNARPLKGKYGLEIETFYFRGSEEGERLAAHILEKLIYVGMENFRLPTISRGRKIGQRRGRDGELKDFYVLRETHMPAVLVELGFLSDDEEAQLLIRPENQELMAKAIVDGIKECFEAKDG